MDAPIRKPFQGVGNIVRFNWHLYVLGPVVMLLLAAASGWAAAPWREMLLVFSLLALTAIVVSLGVSWYVYDVSGLYGLHWLPEQLPDGAHIFSFNAGFDEISALVAARYPAAKVQACDFYDPSRHTEVSIERARRAYPPYAGTVQVATTAFPFGPHGADLILLVFAAHEIRDQAERIAFLTEVRRLLKPGAQVVVVEHLRDWINFLAYTVGFLHFWPRALWVHDFAAAGLHLRSESSLTPFVRHFVLVYDGVTP